MTSTDSSIVSRAILFATTKHIHQTRKANGLPYVTHPLSVMQILIEHDVNDPEVLAAAVLHDTLEDTDTTFDDLTLNFGVVVASIVREVSDDKTLTPSERKKHQIVKASTMSDAAKLIKTADKLDNMRDFARKTPPGYSQEKVSGYFVWGHYVTNACAGMNAELDRTLAMFFIRCYVFENVLYPILPAKERMNEDFSRYLELCDRK